MLRRRQPEVGTWYQNIEQDTLFEVVAVDEDEGMLAIQYYDGDLEELELETFWQLELRDAEQPEDWSGPFEIDQEDRDDLEYSADGSRADADPYYPHDDFDSGEVRVYDDY